MKVIYEIWMVSSGDREGLTRMLPSNSKAAHCAVLRGRVYQGAVLRDHNSICLTSPGCVYVQVLMKEVVCGCQAQQICILCCELQQVVAQAMANPCVSCVQHFLQYCH